MSTEPVYDFAIIGAGVSGLCLAWQLEASTLADRSILLVDGARDDDELRTLSFWSTGPIALEPLVRHGWQTLCIEGDEGRQVVPLQAYSYRTLFFADLQREVKARLARHPRHRVVDGRVRAIEAEAEAVTLQVAGQAYRARWVFDSRFVLHDLVVSPRYHSLRQYFHGWVVRAPQPTWDGAVATLFDFRVEGPPGKAFLYVLPRSATEALVELVTLEPVEAEPVLRAYLLRAFGLAQVELVDHEAGVSPMTEQPFPWRGGPRVRRIGIASGRLKPSTGYALTRILDDGAGIVAALERGGHPMVPPPGDGLFRVLDAVMLNVWTVEPGRIPDLFRRLFTAGAGAGDRVLRFLEQRSGLVDVLRIASSLPTWTMVRAVARWAARRLGW